LTSSATAASCKGVFKQHKRPIPTPWGGTCHQTYKNKI
jgi:hypothetical protein